MSHPALSLGSTQPSRQGFTLVETLIVLAIAGLILSLTLMAIPHLIRSSTNNQRKQDVAGILHAVSRYQLNNSGSFPPDCGGVDNPSCFLHGVKLHHFTLTDISVKLNGPLDPALRSNPIISHDNLEIRHYYRCRGTSDGIATSQGAGYRDIVALYGFESGGSTNPAQCQQL